MTFALLLFKEYAPSRKVYLGARDCYLRHGGGYAGTMVGLTYIRHFIRGGAVKVNRK